MSVENDVTETKVNWKHAVRIIRSIYPPFDLFEDIADPADWPLIISAEQKTNPRLMETIGNLHHFVQIASFICLPDHGFFAEAMQAMVQGRLQVFLMEDVRRADGDD